jgi:hypothetical protein
MMLVPAKPVAALTDRWPRVKTWTLPAGRPNEYSRLTDALRAAPDFRGQVLRRSDGRWSYVRP